MIQIATISSTVSLVDNISSKLTTIKGNLDEVVSSFESLQTSFDTSQNNANNFSWDTFTKNCETAGQKIADVGTKLTLALTTPLVLLGKSMYGAATDHESAFVGVTKTVEGTTEQYERLNEVLYEISETTPTAYVELAGIAQIGGNLGVQIDVMDDFVRSYAALVAATDKHISGEAGAKSVAEFLNIMDGGVHNIERFGSSIVYLGNNFNATEDQILAMAIRMASAASLADFNSAQVLGMATAFTAVGINAEAGGSAASKLIKQMQLATEVGSQAQAVFGTEYGDATAFSYYISNAENLLGVAQDLNVTTDYVESMAGSWLSLEQFAQVSGKTADQFISDWANNPAQGMLDFFYGLNAMDTSGIESAIAMLERMGITEIRESNLVAAMASNPDLFANAIAYAMQGYEENTAMWDEFNKQIQTQENQNAMLGNKLQNTMADFGDNLVTALQPALDCVNGLLESFNALSETEQTQLVETLGAIALLGPALSLVGNGLNAIGNIGTFIGKLPDWGKSLTNFFSGDAGWITLGVAAVTGLITLIESIPTKAESIYQSLQNIPITIDEVQYAEAMAQIDALQAKIDELRANPDQQENLARTSTSVEMGFGTNAMFSNALVYQAAVFEEQYESVANDYSARIAEATQKIIDAEDSATKGYWLKQVETLEAESAAATNQVKQSYSENISALYNGMASQFPEFAQQMEHAAQQYDLMATIQEAFRFDWDAYADEAVAKADWDSLMKSMYSQAFDLGYMSESGYDTKEQLMWAFENGYISNNVGWLDFFQDTVMDDLEASVQAVSDNPIANTWLQTILDSSAIMENLDLTQLTGAMDGIVKALDFNSAMEAAGAAGNPDTFGQYLMEGLANGIDVNSTIPTTSASTVGTATVAALGAALGVQSPSVFAIEQGMYVDLGLAQGITENVGAVTAAVQATGAATIAAMMAVCNQVVATGNSIVNYGAGYSMGANIGRGMAAGIRSQIGAVQAAARALASAAASAASTRLAIHSPSRVFYGFGEMSGLGYINALYDMTGQVERAAGKLFDIEYQAANKAAWNEIQLFGGYEIEDLMNVNNEDYEAKVSDADMKKIRELAEREVIKEITTPTFNIDLHATNYVNSEVDLDGVVSYLEDQVAERLEMVAEGVYE